MSAHPGEATAQVHIELDRPADGLLVGRAEMISGWIAAADDGVVPSASCGGHPVLLRPCFHPIMLERRDAHGFWGYLFLQELLPEVRAGRLRIELHASGRRLGALSLRVTPSARLTATEQPLDLAPYDVPAPASPAAAVDSVIFPGLGGVGGASLNELMRVAMLRAGWDVPVHFEADHAELWRRARAHGTARYRWIDGHGCYGALRAGGRSFARITLLREPARRMLSLFDYGTLVHPRAFAFASFDDFLCSPAAVGATQAASLLRCAGVAAPEDLPAAELYARAQDELARSYALVGVTELYEETILLLCQLAGLRSIGMWWRVLSAPRSVTLDELPARTRARLDALVAVDARLHDEARNALVARLATASLGAALRRYQAGAARLAELPDAAKQLECLRWRQLLVESALAAGAAADVRGSAA